MTRKGNILLMYVTLMWGRGRLQTQKSLNPDQSRMRTVSISYALDNSIPVCSLSAQYTAIAERFHPENKFHSPRSVLCPKAFHAVADYLHKRCPTLRSITNDMLQFDRSTVNNRDFYENLVIGYYLQFDGTGSAASDYPSFAEGAAWAKLLLPPLPIPVQSMLRTEVLCKKVTAGDLDD